MAATIQLHGWYGADAATDAGSCTEISFMSVATDGDPTLEDAACRVTNAITIPGTATCQLSYSKHISACLTTAPTTYVKNFQIWGSFTAQTPPTGTCVLYLAEASGAGTTPADTLIATGDLNDATSGGKATWDAASYSDAGCSTAFLVLQLSVANTACVGTWGPCNLNYSYDEA